MTENLGMNEIIALRRQMAQHAEDVERWKYVLACRIKELQKLVANGEWTTGNPITDYFLQQWGIIDETVAQPLHALEDQMTGKTGQLFLVVHKSRERHRYGGDLRSDDFHLKVAHFMGILADERFVFCEGSGPFGERGSLYGLPTKEYVEVGRSVGDGPPRRGKELVREKGPFLFPVGRGIHPPNTIMVYARAETEFMVVVGDADVLRCPLGGLGAGVSRTWTDILKNAARALGREIPE